MHMGELWPLQVLSGQWHAKEEVGVQTEQRHAVADLPCDTCGQHGAGAVRILPEAAHTMASHTRQVSMFCVGRLVITARRGKVTA